MDLTRTPPKGWNSGETEWTQRLAGGVIIDGVIIDRALYLPRSCASWPRRQLRSQV
jgi:hypothetical protein